MLSRSEFSLVLKSYLDSLRTLLGCESWSLHTGKISAHAQFPRVICFSIKIFRSWVNVVFNTMRASLPSKPQWAELSRSPNSLTSPRKTSEWNTSQLHPTKKRSQSSWQINYVCRNKWKPCSICALATVKIQVLNKAATLKDRKSWAQSLLHI